MNTTSQQIQVIGAGYPRTGTMSLKFALEQLGFGPCYHMIEFIRDPSSGEFWERVFHQKEVDWSELLQPFLAIVDFPGSLFYKELAEIYSDAKVILTTRDPDQWYESMLATVLATDDGKESNSSILRRLIWEETFEGRKHDKAYMVDRYVRHMEEVKACIPSKQLLVFDVNDGWEPISQFLEVNIPSIPFPVANKREDFHAMLTRESQAG